MITISLLLIICVCIVTFVNVLCWCFSGDSRLYKSEYLGNVAQLNRLGSGALISGIIQIRHTLFYLHWGRNEVGKPCWNDCWHVTRHTGGSKFTTTVNDKFFTQTYNKVDRLKCEFIVFMA